MQKVTIQSWGQLVGNDGRQPRQDDRMGLERAFGRPIPPHGASRRHGQHAVPDLYMGYPASNRDHISRDVRAQDEGSSPGPRRLPVRYRARPSPEGAGASPPTMRPSSSTLGMFLV